MMDSILNFLSNLGAPIARALQRPSVAADAIDGLMFTIGPDESYNFLRCRIDLAVILKNKTPVTTTIQLEKLAVSGMVEDVDYKIDSGIIYEQSSFKNQSTLEMGGGKTIHANLQLFIKITNKDLKKWGSQFEGEMIFSETYGTNIAPARLVIKISDQPPPAVPADNLSWIP